jgi:[ribosomal protein S18]-alanine N-acetyltransferase
MIVGMRASDPPGGPSEFFLRPMSQSDAEEIASWHYPGEYSFYDSGSDPADLAELLDCAARADEYFAVEAGSVSLIGFFQYKHPHGRDLEIGLGLRPDWTGRGLGERFLEAGLGFARRTFAPVTFRLLVATFNRRAITVYERAGFTTVRAYMHHTNGGDWPFLEMRREA